MTQSAAEAKQKIRETIDFLISHKREITIQIEGHETSFASRIIMANHGDISLKTGKRPELIIERLTPEKGNILIKSGPHLIATFSLRNTYCRFKTRYLSTTSEGPSIGLVVSFPESIDVREKRRRDRRGDEIPEFVSVAVRVKNGSKKDKTYELGIFDCTAHGVGILVKKRYFDLREIVEVGDKLRDITLYGPQTIVKVDGTVRHKSKKRGMQDEDFYVVGVEFDEPLKDFKSL